MIIIPIKWLFHWEYTQHFQTNPSSHDTTYVAASKRSLARVLLLGRFCTKSWRVDMDFLKVHRAEKSVDVITNKHNKPTTGPLPHRIHVCYIWYHGSHQSTPNVSIYTIHGSYGIWKILQFSRFLGATFCSSSASAACATPPPYMAGSRSGHARTQTHARKNVRIPAKKTQKETSGRMPK